MTWFDETGSDSRKLLYRLENMNIVRFCQKKAKKKGFYTFTWELTDKGKKLVSENEILQESWGDGITINVSKFYEEVLKHIRKENI